MSNMLIINQIFNATQPNLAEINHTCNVVSNKYLQTSLGTADTFRIQHSTMVMQRKVNYKPFSLLVTKQIAYSTLVDTLKNMIR